MAVTISGTNGIAVPLGSASAPSESNTTSATTGAYYPSGTTYALSTNGTNALYIDASQNVGIGTTSPSYKLHVYGNDASQIRIGVQNTNATGAAEFIAYASGLTGSPYGAFSMNSNSLSIVNSSTTTATVSPTSGVSIQMFTSSANIGVGHATGTSSGNTYSTFAYAGTQIGSISQNGTTGVLFNITSDQRLKTNIVNAPSASYIIGAIQIRSFDWKSDNSHNRYGVIAQELVQVAPEAVYIPINETDMMGVDYSKLVPIMVKAIQELSAEVEVLKAKVGA